MEICKSFSVFHDALKQLGEMRLLRTLRVSQYSESMGEGSCTKESSSRAPAQVWSRAHVKLKFSQKDGKCDDAATDEATKDAAPSATTIREIRPALEVLSKTHNTLSEDLDSRMETNLALVMHRMKLLRTGTASQISSDKGESSKPSEPVQRAIGVALKPIENKLDSVLAASGAASDSHTNALEVAISRALEPTLSALQELQSQMADLTKRLDERTT
eukprot:1280912-Prymnesium_polylepis.1